MYFFILYLNIWVLLVSAKLHSFYFQDETQKTEELNCSPTRLQYFHATVLRVQGFRGRVTVPAMSATCRVVKWYRLLEQEGASFLDALLFARWFCWRTHYRGWWHSYIFFVSQHSRPSLQLEMSFNTLQARTDLISLLLTVSSFF